MALQQFQFKTSVFTGTKRASSAGQDLAKLVTSGLKLGSTYMDQKVKENDIQQKEYAKEDARNLQWLQGLAYEYAEKNPNQTFDNYSNYINNDIKQDPRYIEKFGDKDPKDVLKTVDGKSSLNLWSSKAAKEFGKTPDEIAEMNRKKNASVETLNLTDILTQGNNYLTENNYESMATKDKVSFLTGHIEEQEKSTSNFKDPTVKYKAAAYVNGLKNNLVALQDKQKVETADGAYTNFRNSYASNPSAYDNKTIDDMFDTLNFSLPNNSQLPKKTFYTGILNSINATIVNNPEKYAGKTKEQLEKEFPIFGQIKDETIKVSLNNTFQNIDKKTKTAIDLANVMSGGTRKETTNLTDAQIQSGFDQEFNAVVNAAANAAQDGTLTPIDKDNQSTKIGSIITRANENNVSIPTIENAAASLFTDRGTNTNLSHRNYLKIKGVQELGYVIRNKKAAEYFNKLEAVAVFKEGIDLDTEDGFADAMNILEQAEASGITINKKDREAIDAKLEDLTSSSVVGSALSFIAGSPVMGGGNEFTQAAFPVLKKNTEMYMKLGLDADKAFDKAKEDYIVRHQDTGMTNLEDVGVYTKKDYDILTDFLSYEQSNSKYDVEKIEVFGDTVLVNFDGGSSKELQQQRFSKTDLYKKFNRAKSNTGIKPTMSEDKDSKFGGSTTGGNTGIGTFLSGKGVMSNADFSDKSLEPIAQVANYFGSNLKPGETMTVNEKQINAFFGNNSLDVMKKKFETGNILSSPIEAAKTAMNIFTESNPAHVAQSIAGKFTITKDKNGTFVLEGSGMQYNFSKSEQKNLFFSNDKSKSIVLHFNQKQMKNIKPSKEPETIVYSKKLAKDYNINQNTIMTYGLYDVKNPQFMASMSQVYNGFKDKMTRDKKKFTEKDIMKKTVAYLADEYGQDIFSYENIEYAFGEKALDFINNKKD